MAAPEHGFTWMSIIPGLDLLPDHTATAGLIAGGILAGGWVAQTNAARLGPGFSRFFNLDHARLVRCFVSTTMFLTSELALLIWWLRSQSLKDFNGRYRGWVLCGVAGMVAAFAIQSDAASAWNQTIAWLSPVDPWHKAAVYWMPPALFCGLAVLRFLWREMRDCRLSLSMLVLSSVLFATLVGLLLSRPINLPPVEARLLECGTAMLASLSLFLSLLLQARNAIYFSVEPPVDQPSSLLVFVRLFKKFAAAASKKGTAGDSKIATASSKAASKGTKRRKPPAPTAESASDAEEPSANAIPSPTPAAMPKPASVPSVPAVASNARPAAAVAERTSDLRRRKPQPGLTIRSVRRPRPEIPQRSS